MKNSTKLLFKGVKVLTLSMLLGMTSGIAAETYYVRPEGDATSWSAMTGVTPQQIITSNAPVIDTVSTYYFAKGTYVLTASKEVDGLPVPISPRLTTGKIYGGFSGAETAIDLAAREIEDKDMNGIVEPWEFKNETVFKGAVPANDIAGSNLRLIVVTGGEVNGVTFNDCFYKLEVTSGTETVVQSGAIVLGKATVRPQLADDMDEYAGKLTLSTVRKIIVAGVGPVMLTNKNSQVDQCLIEECVALGGEKNTGGGAIWMNALGGKVTNSVIRNCESRLGNVGTGKAGAIWAQHPSYDYRSDAPDCTTLIYNCLIHNNSASAYGAAVRVEGKNGGKTKAASVINCTILNNYTPTTGTGSLEMIFDGCLAVNNIVLNADDCFEQRVQAARHFVSNTIYGSITGQTTYSPGTDMVAEKNISDMRFVKPLYYVGAVGSEGGIDYDEEVFDSIRTANFRISSAESPAVTTPGALTLPATFPSSEALADPTPIPVVGSIPATDMLGVSRATSNTLGAYQYVPVSGFSNARIEQTLSVISLPNAVLVNNQQGKEIVFYSSSGQLIHKQLLKSNNEIISLNSGFYVVAVDKLKAKVIVK